MTIQQSGSEIVIRLSSRLKLKDIKEFIDYLTYKEAIADSKASQTDIDKLSREVNKGWWKSNRVRFVNENCD